MQLPWLTTIRIVVTLATVAGVAAAQGAERLLDAKMHHLRSGAEREWSEFPAEAEAAELRLAFEAAANSGPSSLRLRHRDVKQTWRLLLNDREIGRLPTDENPMATVWDLPTGALRTGENTLVVKSSGGASDDILLGDVRLVDRARDAVLREATLRVQVEDADTGQRIPVRITIVDQQGSLASVGAESSARLAVRPGVVYTADGQAEFGLPAGKYTIYAGRGFEYGIDSKAIEMAAGQQKRIQLAIRREVPLPGYASCDTHVHTFTFSRHGDATLQERLVTIAGEGLELPVATDHNLQIDYEPVAREAGLRQYFTPIVGDEVTTRVGHFNVFPLDPAATPIDHQGRDWAEVFAAIARQTSPQADVPRIVVLNHPRDVHAGFRPFDPQRHVSDTGEDLDGWVLKANAMELVNSGTVQSDPWRVVHDWLGLINAGLRITPVGSSDSHDVARYIVGQGRTYVRCPEDDPGRIDRAAALTSLAGGRVLVSFGLVVEIAVNERYGPGDLVPASTDADLQIRARVLGPSWTQASQLVLFVNGKEVRREMITAADAGRQAGGVKCEVQWRLPRPKHDIHLAAVAIGPGVRELYWPTPKPYQPDGPDWTPYVCGATGSVWVDADGRDGFTSPRQYAAELLEKTGQDTSRLADLLVEYDEAVGAQVRALQRMRKP